MWLIVQHSDSTPSKTRTPDVLQTAHLICVQSLEERLDGLGWLFYSGPWLFYGPLNRMGYDAPKKFEARSAVIKAFGFLRIARMIRSAYLFEARLPVFSRYVRRTAVRCCCTCHHGSASVSVCAAGSRSGGSPATTTTPLASTRTSKFNKNFVGNNKHDAFLGVKSEFCPVRWLSGSGAVGQTLLRADSVSGRGEKTEEVEAVDGLKPLYLDAQATTPMDPRVVDAMLPFLVSQFGNPHSRSHAYGWESEAAVENARKQVADLIGAKPQEIIFTSGATESNNVAVKGVARFYKAKKNHIITTQTEHKCVLDSCRFLEAEGFNVTYLPVQQNGVISLKDLENAMTDKTSLVSIMTVNNEIGVRQPISEIGKLCRERKVFFHTDAAQAVGKIPMSVNDMNIDLMSISGHKIYGPKGVGALYVRRLPRVRLEAQMSGGGQERGLRSGTVPTPLTVGLGAAAQICREEMELDYAHVSGLAERLISQIMKELPDVVRNGDENMTYPGCVNLSFSYVEGESLLMGLKDIALSSGSACTSASLEPSYVLRAIGTDEELAHSSIRFGLGRFTTEREVDYTVAKCIREVRKLREMSPLWEMVQEGIDLKSIQWTQH